MPPLDPLVLAAFDAQAALLASAGIAATVEPPGATAPYRGRAVSVGEALARTPATPLATASAVGGLDRDTAAERAVASPRGPLRASDLVRVGILELVLAGLDAGVAPDRQALRVCCRLLAQVLVERHPGRSVELRVPPYAAVQLGEAGGPVHTRGTPPNVVEFDPLVFVEVASGRRPWAAAIDSGEVRASGARADLSAYLPVL